MGCGERLGCSEDVISSTGGSGRIGDDEDKGCCGVG